MKFDYNDYFPLVLFIWYVESKYQFEIKIIDILSIVLPEMLVITKYSIS